MTSLLSLYSQLFSSAFAYKRATKSGWLVILGFFLLSQIVVTLLSGGNALLRNIPHFLTDARTAIIRSREYIPDNTTIVWDASTNQLSLSNIQLPVQIPVSAFSDLRSFHLETLQPIPKYALTIPSDISEESYLQESFITVQSDGLAIQGTPATSFSSVSFASFPQFSESFTVTGEYMFSYASQFLDKIESSIFTIWPLLLLLMLPVTIGMTLLNLVLDAFFVILLVKLNKYSISTSESIQLAILISGVASIINQIAVTLYPAIQWPFYSLTFWLIVSYVLLFNKRMW